MEGKKISDERETAAAAKSHGPGRDVFVEVNIAALLCIASLVLTRGDALLLSVGHSV